MEDIAPKSLCDFYAIKAAGAAVEEVALKVETIETISSEEAQDRMRELMKWKDESHERRRLVLFVPMGLKIMACTILAGYDEVIEYRA